MAIVLDESAHDRTALYWALLGHGFVVEGVPRAHCRRFATVLRAGPEPIDTTGGWTLTPVNDGWELVDTGADRTVHRGSLEQLLLRLEFLAISKAFERWPNPPWLHAALAARGDAGVVLVGPKESGKSTLAAALWQAGWRLISDDAVILLPDGRVSGVPRRVSLRSGGAALLSRSRMERLKSTLSWQPRADGCVFHPDEIGEGDVPAAAVVPRAVVFLKRLGAESITRPIVPLAGATALTSGIAYSNVIRHAGVGEALQAFTGLFLRVPAYDMQRGRLADMVAGIEGMVQPVGGDRPLQSDGDDG